jgi:uncharacterized membrane protein
MQNKLRIGGNKMQGLVRILTLAVIIALAWFIVTRVLLPLIGWLISIALTAVVVVILIIIVMKLTNNMGDKP